MGATFPLILTHVGDDAHMWGGWGGGWMWFWGALMMTFWGLVVAGIIWAVVRATRRPEPDPRARARELLAERFARGEISAEEYHERLSALR